MSLRVFSDNNHQIAFGTLGRYVRRNYKVPDGAIYEIKPKSRHKSFLALNLPLRVPVAPGGA